MIVISAGPRAGARNSSCRVILFCFSGVSALRGDYRFERAEVVRKVPPCFTALVTQFPQLRHSAGDDLAVSELPIRVCLTMQPHRSLCLTMRCGRNCERRARMYIVRTS